MFSLSRMPKEWNGTLYTLYLVEIQISEEEFKRGGGGKTDICMVLFRWIQLMGSEGVFGILNLP